MCAQTLLRNCEASGSEKFSSTVKIRPELDRMETANIIDGMVSNENGEEVSPENEEAIRDLLQEYDQSVLEPPTHPPASTQSVSNPTLPRTYCVFHGNENTKMRRLPHLAPTLPRLAVL